MREQEILDDKNMDILSVIRHNARMNYEQIGKAVGMSRVAVKKRMDAMEQAGIIQEYETKLKRISTGQAQSFVLEVETTPYDFEAVMNLLGKNPYIHQLFIMTGNCHLQAIGSVPNAETLKVYANRISKELCDVRRFSFHTILSVRKDVDGGIDYYEEGNDK